MTTLLIRLAGPMQAWGAASRFARRDTRSEPTKSGVVGLLAAAQGRRRTDPIEDLAALRFGVRTDQPGTLIRDFQTARSLDDKRTMPLSYRFYLGDAAFVAGVEGDRDLIDGLAAALQRPRFPLYLGRRSCPPSAPLFMSVVDDPVADALRDCPWVAADWYRRKQTTSVQLRIVLDGDDGDLVRDHPINYSPEHRQYGWRTVTEDFVVVDNPKGLRRHHDPMAAVGGA